MEGRARRSTGGIYIGHVVRFAEVPVDSALSRGRTKRARSLLKSASHEQRMTASLRTVLAWPEFRGEGSSCAFRPNAIRLNWRLAPVEWHHWVSDELQARPPAGPVTQLVGPR